MEFTTQFKELDENSFSYFPFWFCVFSFFEVIDVYRRDENIHKNHKYTSKSSV